MKISFNEGQEPRLQPTRIIVYQERRLQSNRINVYQAWIHAPVFVRDG